MGKDQLLDLILVTARSKWSGSGLVAYLFTQKAHGPIKVMKVQTIDALDEIITAPAAAEAVRTWDHQPVKDRKENSALDIEFILTADQHPVNGSLDAGFFPQSLEDQRRADFLGISANIALAGYNQQSLLGELWQGADQSFNAPLRLQLIHAADGRDHALFDFAFFFAVLYDLQVLVFAGFLHAGEHGSLHA
jgi:hypothetical protein